MNGDQFQHLSQEISSLREDMDRKFDRVFDKLDKKLDTSRFQEMHDRLSKHQIETEKEDDNMQLMINQLNGEVAKLKEDKAADKAELNLEIDRLKATNRFMWKVIIAIGGIIGVISQSSWILG